MIPLRLAEYKEGKFERFLEIGRDFLFGGSFIYLPLYLSPEFPEDRKKQSVQDFHGDLFTRDEKDPLNRFKGRFDLRTFGEGRFVLIKGGEDEVAELEGQAELGYSWDSYGWSHLGNLHQNPELFERLS